MEGGREGKGGDIAGDDVAGGGAGGRGGLVGAASCCVYVSFGKMECE
jgi:hypothetical protein